MSGYTTTPNYNLRKPIVGADIDAWGGDWNINADTIDTTMKANANAVAALGTMAQQNANNINVTGGSATAITLWSLSAGITLQASGPYVPALLRTWRDSAGNVAGGIDPSGVLQWGKAHFIAATIDTLTLPTGSLSLTSITATSGAVGGETIQQSSAPLPFDYWMRDPSGNIFLAYGSGAWNVAKLNVAGDLTVNGQVLTPSAAAPSYDVPEYAYDVTKSGVVGDGKRGWHYVTWSASSATLSAYTFSGLVSIAAGSKALSITGVFNGGVAFQQSDVGAPIWVQGAGPSGGDLVTVIDGFTDGQNVTLHDAASTALTGAGNTQLMWPCFVPSDAGKVLWMSNAQFRVYWPSSASQLVDTGDVYPVQPLLAKINSYVSPTSITVLTITLPGSASAIPREIIVGTDNASAIATAGRAAAALNKRALYFKGVGLYCSFSSYAGTVNEWGWPNFTMPDSTAGPTNLQEAAERDMVWLTGRARGFFCDTNGERLYRVLVPLTAPPALTPRRGVYGHKSLAASGQQTAPVMVRLGDSMGNTDPQIHNQAFMIGTLWNEFVREQNPDRTWQFDNYSIGGSTWGELACDTNTRGANMKFAYWFWQDTTKSLMWYALNHTPVPDLFHIANRGYNDGPGFHPIHVFSVLKRLRALLTRASVAPDIMLETSHVGGTSWIPSMWAGYNFQESNSMFLRTVAAKLGYGCIDYEPRAVATQWGTSPTERLYRRIPDSDQAITPSLPYVVNAKARMFKGRLTLIGATGAAVWSAFGTLRFQLSMRRDNYLELGVDASGFLTKYVQSWGASVPTPCVLTNGSATLATSGQATGTLNILFFGKASSITLGAGGSGPFTTANNGQCLLLSTGDYGNTPQRTFIQRVVTTDCAHVSDWGPVTTVNLNASGTYWMGGMMFTEHDAYAQSDIVINDGAGHVHRTQITGFTDRNTVTLRDPWPYPNFSGTATIWVGHVSVPLTSTTIPAGTDLGPNPWLDFSVRGKHLFLRYAVGSSITLASNWPQEPPIFDDEVVIRGGGRFVWTVACTGAGGTIQGRNLWVDDDMITMPVGTLRYTRGYNDTPLFSYVYGGGNNHPGSAFAAHVAEPVLRAQDFAA